MGRNSDTFNGFLQDLEKEWRPYHRALSLPEQREAMTAIFTRARILVAASTAQAPHVRMDGFYVSLLVSLTLDVDALKRENTMLREKLGVGYGV
ncbi:hypothetical protein BH09SUM1_BH09SUM1_28280 [soil metagenome]